MAKAEQQTPALQSTSLWMKFFYQPANGPITKARAWTYAMLNVFATPGFGSLLARRTFPALGQLTMALAGAVLIMFWFFQKMRLFYGQVTGTTIPLDSGNTAGKIGLILFAASWVWTLITSIQIILSAAPEPTTLPPKIS